MDVVQRGDNGPLDQLLTRLVQAAVDGIGPFKGARDLVDPLRRKGMSTEAVVDRVVRTQVTQATVQGAVSGLGGFVTALAALAPATAASMFVQARLSAAIAYAYGHDLDDPLVRDQVARLVSGTSMSAGVQKAGRDASEKAARALLPRVQGAAAKVAAGATSGRAGAIATRVATGTGSRAVPVVGAAVAGAIDLAVTRRVAEKARREFDRPVPGATPL